MPRTFTPQLKTVDGRLAFIGRSGTPYFLDDHDTDDCKDGGVAGARQAAFDQPPPRWGNTKQAKGRDNPDRG